jgi:putative FmdB family regulatory protein
VPGLGARHDTEGDRVPTYQYVCHDCGESLEAVQKFSDDALTECPTCGGKLRKVYSAVGVVFKGSGFYRNDSRSSSSSSTPASAGKSDASAPAAASTSSSSSSEGSSSSAASSSSPASSTDAKPAAKKTGDSKVA